MRELSRREIGSGATGAGVALVRRRLDALEQRLAVLTGLAHGCAHCTGWAVNAILHAAGAEYLDGDTDSGWPDPPVCPRCGRRPAHTITIAYVDAVLHGAPSGRGARG